jgi:hypothetical protein
MVTQTYNLRIGQTVFYKDTNGSWNCGKVTNTSHDWVSVAPAHIEELGYMDVCESTMLLDASQVRCSNPTQKSF